MIGRFSLWNVVSVSVTVSAETINQFGFRYRYWTETKIVVSVVHYLWYDLSWIIQNHKHFVFKFNFLCQKSISYFICIYLVYEVIKLFLINVHFFTASRMITLKNHSVKAPRKTKTSQNLPNLHTLFRYLVLHSFKKAINSNLLPRQTLQQKTAVMYLDLEAITRKHFPLSLFLFGFFRCESFLNFPCIF